MDKAFSALDGALPNLTRIDAVTANARRIDLHSFLDHAHPGIVARSTSYRQLALVNLEIPSYDLLPPSLFLLFPP